MNDTGRPRFHSVLCPREPNEGPEGDWPQFLDLYPGAKCLLRVFSAGDTCVPVRRPGPRSTSQALRGGLGEGRWFSVSMGAPCSGVYFMHCVAHSSWHTRGVPSIFVEFNVLQGQGFLHLLFTIISAEEPRQVF